MARGDVSHRSISIVIKSKAYNGSYSVSGNMLTASYGGKSSKAQIGNMPPETLARMMLDELVTQSSH